MRRRSLSVAVLATMFLGTSFAGPTDPAAVIDIAKWQNEGYSYMWAGWYPRLTRDEVVKQHPELQ